MIETDASVPFNRRVKDIVCWDSVLCRGDGVA